MTVPLTAAGPLLLGAVLAFTPSFRNGTVLFGIHVSPEWLTTEEAKRAILIYRLQIAAWTLLATVLGLPGGIAAAVLPFLILAAAALWLNLHWDRIPERFPVHFDLAGHPNRWNTRTTKGVFGPILVAASVLVMLAVSAIVMVRGAPRGAAGTQRYPRANLSVLGGAMWMIAISFGYIAVMPTLPFLPVAVLPAMLLIGTLLLLPLVRLQRNAEAADDASPDAGWKLGLIYYNPKDPALMVQRRFGAGYTLNMANRLAWVFMVAILALPAVTIALLR